MGVQSDARFCEQCGNSISRDQCVNCRGPLAEDERFCPRCGNRALSETSSTDSSPLQNLIVAFEASLQQVNPNRVKQAAGACLDKNPPPEYAAIASLTLMSAVARLGDLAEAESSLHQSRQFYADHLGIVEDQRAQFLNDGHFIDDLQAIGDKDLHENAWLYFLLGHSYGPRLPETYEGASDIERLQKAGADWADFFSEWREERLRTLSYLYLKEGRWADAAKFLEKLSLIARKYESFSPVRIEVLWPRVLLGDCYWALGQKDKATACWRGASSAAMCIDPALDSWERLGVLWIEKGRSKLVEYRIQPPNPEISAESSRHLALALEHLLEAEQCERASVDTDELVSTVRQAGRRYTVPLGRASSELDVVNRLDPFVWAKAPIGDSSSWFRYENVKSLQLQKAGIVHMGNEQVALACACYKQAMDIWPTLTGYAVVGGLQAACGLVNDARATYQTCVICAEELGAVESSEGVSESIREIRQALIDLGS